MQHLHLRVIVPVFLFVLSLPVWASNFGLPYRVVATDIPGATEITVLVRDANTEAPIAGTKVLLSFGRDANGVLDVTDQQGIARFPIVAGADVNSVTFTTAHSDFHKLTVFEVMGQSFELFLQPNPRVEDYVFLEGKFIGWPTGVSVTRAEAGLFLPAFQANTLLDLNLNRVISSHTVPMTVVGNTFQIPGNLVLPPQDKKYGFFTIHLEKPRFIMPVRLGTEGYMVGLMGDVSIKGLVDRAREKDYLGAMNLTRFSKLDWTQWRTVNGAAEFDIPVNRFLQRNKVESNHQTIPAGLDLVAFSLLDPMGDQKALVPMDIKAMSAAAINRGPTRMSRNPKGVLRLSGLTQSPTGAQTYVFSAILDKEQFATNPGEELVFSGALTRANKEVTGLIRYMGLITQNSVSADHREYQFSLPAIPELTATDLEPEFLVVNVFSETKLTNPKVSLRKLIWASVLPNNSRGGSIRLPLIDRSPVLPTPGPNEKFYWEVIAVRRTLSHNGGVWDSTVSLSNLEHVSHAREGIAQ